MIFIKKRLYSKYVYSLFRKLYFIYFKFRGGFGGKYGRKYLKELNKTEYASLDQLKDLQSQKLQKLIHEVYENVPYYRKIMDERNILPSDIKTPKDLSIFPLLDKETIRNNLYELLNNRYRYNLDELLVVKTGGSTGKPMKFYLGKHEYGVYIAHIERWKKYAGVKQFEKYMYIGMDENAKQKKDYEGIYTPFNFYLMSSFNLNDFLLNKYLKNIKKFKPNHLRGFASACYILADYFKRNNLNYPLNAVLTSSDELYSFQREVIEKVFSCEVFEHYGQNEDVISATECEFHNGYHVNMESCTVEVLDENDEQLDEGNTGRLIGTQLENYSMPLIRYEIGDMGSITSKKCSCGREHIKIKSLSGRIDDVIITPDGKKITSPMSVPMKYFYEEILEVQLIQKKADLIIVKIVPTDKYTLKTEKKFEECIKYQIGNKIQLKFEKVSKIPRTKGGKHRMVISELI